MRRLNHLAGTLLLCGAAVACGDPEGHGNDYVDTTLMESHEHLFVDTSTLRGHTVSVCWKNWDSDITAHNFVRDAVERTWGFFADIRFTGWGSCGSGGADIEINVGDAAWPRVTCGLGTSMCEMYLNFADNSTYCGFGHPDEDYRSCMEFIAIHEFGHALGFAHEQNRNDTPGACTKDAQGSDGNVQFGDWDWNSVMNYCNPAYAAHPQLSQTDQKGVQRFYGTNVNALSAQVAAITAPLL